MKYIFIFCAFILFVQTNFTDPITTTGDGGTPNLSDNGQDAIKPQIATDSTGEHVYAIWLRNNGSNNIVQVAISSNSGVSWIDPTATTDNGGTPNLSNNGQNAFTPHK